MRVWIDITAPAHVLVFRPLIGLIEARGGQVAVTTRAYAQTPELVEQHGIQADRPGHPRRRSQSFYPLPGHPPTATTAPIATTQSPRRNMSRVYPRGLLCEAASGG